ncbi:hypothetical protein Plhal710r2_c033g0122081 [Plasmopara halstedii]
MRACHTPEYHELVILGLLLEQTFDEFANWPSREKSIRNCHTSFHPDVTFKSTCNAPSQLKYD